MVYEMTISATHHFPRQAAQNLIPSKHIDLYLPIIIMVAGSYRVPPASSGAAPIAPHDVVSWGDGAESPMLPLCSEMSPGRGRVYTRPE